GGEVGLELGALLGDGVDGFLRAGDVTALVGGARHAARSRRDLGELRRPAAAEHGAEDRRADGDRGVGGGGARLRLFALDALLGRALLGVERIEARPVLGAQLVDGGVALLAGGDRDPRAELGLGLARL